jgi:hypothetical protein
VHEENGSRRPGHLVFAWSPHGYTLHERSGDPPAVGAELEEDGQLLVVTKIGASPLPGDRRACAYTSGRV